MWYADIWHMSRVRASPAPSPCPVRAAVYTLLTEPDNVDVEFPLDRDCLSDPEFTRCQHVE